MALNITVLLAYLALCRGGYWLAEKKKDFEIKNPKALLWVVLAAAFGLRVVLALQDVYFKIDIVCFKGWAEATAYYGIDKMYHSGMFLDYPPGYMYVLAFIKLIQSVLGLPYESLVYTCLIKMPAILADMGCSLFVYKIAAEKRGEKAGFIYAALMALCPATIFTSAIWGQVDSIFALLLMLSLYAVYKNDTLKAALWYALALLVKPQALLFGPVMLFYIIERKDWKEFFKAVGTGLSIVYLLALPYAGTLSPMWLVNLYMSTFGGYRFFTINGYNLYMALDKNWYSLDRVSWSGLINPLVIIACFILCRWGYARIKDKSKPFTTSLVFIMVFFSFCTMMHERYLYPAIILSLVAFVLTENKHFFTLFTVTGTANLINTVMSFISQENSYIVPPALYKTVGAATVAACVLAMGLYIRQALDFPALKLRKKHKEIIAVATLTAFYTVFAFYKLGDTKSPRTFWQADNKGEWVTLKFDRPRNVKSIAAYTGMGDREYPDGDYNNKIGCDFEVMYSDGVQWQSAVQFDHSYVFTWKIKPVDFTADYILVRANSANQVLNEIIFTDRQGEVIPVAVAEMSDKTSPYSAALAVDEQELIPADEGYYSSMYFDEIYHARTSWEQLKGYPIYETTHPPLGKILISIGIAIFGMTPFGWRIMGTLAGVAMISVIYLLAKQLLKNEKAAFLCAALYSVDFMHYTQTRIATVDSFLTLFVMLMFLFMAKYAEIPLDKDRNRQYRLLFAGGVFMGCAIAVKWNGAYGAAGLAVFFFINLLLKHKDFTAGDKSKQKQANKLAFTTCLWCVLFFVIIPFAIYFASFLPVFRGDGSIKAMAEEFIRYQVNMFDYHSKLEAEHFFSSMWYTWPVIIKPIWYSATRAGAGVSSISAFGNPAVWLPMVPCMVYMLAEAWKKKDRSAIPVICGYLGCYLPWVLVTRLAFIYHYFPATIFGTLAIGYMAKIWLEKTEKPDVETIKPGKKQNKTGPAAGLNKKELALAGYLLAALALFIIYLPVISGLPVAQAYADKLELLGTWYFN